MGGLQSWLDTLGPYVATGFAAVNLWVMLRTRGEVKQQGRDLKELEVNHNSKMDQLLAAKDATADARVGEADAVGAERGRSEEIARQAQTKKEE